MATLKELLINLIQSGEFLENYEEGLNTSTVVFTQDSDGVIYGFNTDDIIFRPELAGNEWYYATDNEDYCINHSFHDSELSSDYKTAMVPAASLYDYFLDMTAKQPTLKEMLIGIIRSGRFIGKYPYGMDEDTKVFTQDSDGSIYGFNTENVHYRADPRYASNEWYYINDDGSDENDWSHNFRDNPLASDYKIAMVPAKDLKQYFSAQSSSDPSVENDVDNW